MGDLVNIQEKLDDIKIQILDLLYSPKQIDKYKEMLPEFMDNDKYVCSFGFGFISVFYKDVQELLRFKDTESEKEIFNIYIHYIMVSNPKAILTYEEFINFCKILMIISPEKFEPSNEAETEIINKIDEKLVTSSEYTYGSFPLKEWKVKFLLDVFEEKKQSLIEDSSTKILYFNK